MVLGPACFILTDEYINSGISWTMKIIAKLCVSNLRTTNKETSFKTWRHDPVIGMCGDKKKMKPANLLRSERHTRHICQINANGALLSTFNYQAIHVFDYIFHLLVEKYKMISSHQYSPINFKYLFKRWINWISIWNTGKDMSIE